MTSIKRGRPVKPRMVRNEPKTRQFSPRGRRGRPGHRELKIEEFEAIRLADFMGLSQRDAAAFMKVSQQTFSRVLRNGRKSVAEALIKGEIIGIRGGDFKLEKISTSDHKSVRRDGVIVERAQQDTQEKAQ